MSDGGTVSLAGRLARCINSYGWRYAAARLAEEAGNVVQGLSAFRPGGRLSSCEESPRRHIVILAGIHWRFRFQRPQQLAMSFERAGCRVYYVSPGTAGAATPGWRLQSGVNGQPARVCLYSTGYGDLRALWQKERLAAGAALSLQLLCDKLRECGTPLSVLVQHPLWYGVITRLKGVPCFYDCLDDFADFAGAPPGLSKAEQRLVEGCAGVVSSALPLHCRWKSSGRAQAIIRNGCDYERFAAARPLASLPSGGIIGYHGALDDWFDVEIVRMLACALPERTIVLVGGDRAGVGARLKGLANVRLTGEVEYDRLPPYVAAFDVGLVPFEIRPLTQCTNPVKVYEYLAAGKPVVSSSLPEMEVFGDLVSLARGVEWVGAVARALEAPPDRERLRAFAARQTWDERAGEFLDFIRRCGL